MAAVAALPARFGALLVGGALRDRFLRRSSSDFDAVVAGEGDRAAELLSEQLGVRWFRLGGERFAAYRLEGEGFRVDLFDRSPLSLDDDLRRRDLTINSMALDLGRWTLIDPFAGRKDLERRRLRATTDRSFEDDPLRVLRLVRFAGQLHGFSVDERTLGMASAAAPSLTQSAGERIREELRAAFERPDIAFELLRSLELYPSLWVEESTQTPSMKAIEERIQRLDATADRLEQLGLQVDRFLATQAILFAPLAANRLDVFRARGFLSNRDARAIAALLAWPGHPASDADRRWLLHSLGAQWPTATAYLGATTDSDGWGQQEESLVELARTASDTIFTPPPLLDGHEISQLLDLAPGPRLGKLVAGLRRAQIEGRVHDRDGAIEWLREQPAVG